ncbi:MFS transporter [Alicyclobacillus tolerans]|uniref:MFS transporter n=1 Tax=Alicyclobacillus tolerans TaxID=90970 RepID=UPI003B781AD6
MAHITVYLAARGVSQIGDFILLIAVNIWVLNITHSPTAVSILWIIPALAQLMVSPWAGSITDRLNRRSVMIVTEFIRAALIAGMTISAHVWLLYLLLFFVNGVGSFFSASSAPYVTYLVPNHRRKRVNGIRGALQSGAIVVGPAVTGLIVNLTGGISSAIWIDAITFFVSAVSLFVLPSFKSSLEEAPNTKEKPAYFRVWVLDLRKAMQVLRQRAFFTFVLSLVTLSGVIGAATDSQEVVFAKGVLHLSPSQYSFLVSIAGAGYVFGAIFVAILANKFSLNILIGVGSLFGSVGFVMYAFSHSLGIAAIGFVVLGIFISLSSSGFSTFYQMSLPPEYMGRVANVTTPITQGLIIVLTVTAGFMADAIGVRMMTIGFTICMLLLGITTFIAMLFQHSNPISESHTSA